MIKIIRKEKMKQIIIFLLFFLVSYSYSQDKDTLITPNIPFPEQLLNKKSGFLYVNFIINHYFNKPNHNLL